MIWGWQLTRAGISIGPVFVWIMGLQTNLVAKCEVRNKRARKDVARVYYESILDFDKPASHCLSTRVRVAFVEECSCGVTSALVYLVEAISRRCAHRQGHVRAPSDILSPQPRRFHWLQTRGLHANNRQIRCSYARSKPAREPLAHGKLGVSGRPPSKGLRRCCLQQWIASTPTDLGASVLKTMLMGMPHGECVAIVGASGCDIAAPAPV
ncbi:hypothetical protein AZE42_05671 [Rhizopogon vesiculosus]|uniref:Uncharacterized protein n=1 Tax=Rhizopogon vesiculosus TaxID=180088 RepID=A0A1J8QFM5_9AGAM|nr:hypothetical protein AZE42_05671 [Rhizopogon vesiculosus]